MDSILNKIVKVKYNELPALKEERLHCTSPATTLPPKVSFLEKLSNSQRLQLIAEVKRGSPSKGHFAPDLNVPLQVAQYINAGASAISVLTDKEFFYGGYDDLKTVSETATCPILCKDFIIDEVQIDLAKQYGATMILLIVAVHKKERLKELLDYALENGLEVLLEVHNEEEMDCALSLKAPIIGVNNRNLKTFETSIEVSIRLIDYAKGVGGAKVFFISESGIKTLSDVERLAAAGFSGILVGESLIKNRVDGSLCQAFARVMKNDDQG